jgi:iron(III) transport system ATP-binding protein
MDGLHVFGLSHSYGVNKVLDNVGLMIPSGELVCMLGPSGCGKSTLLRLAGGLEKVQEGTIVINDVTVGTSELHLNPEHRRIGLMFQDYALFPHLSIIKNVTFGLFGMPADKARARAMAMLDQVGMTSHAEKYPHMLSGGQQQRVALARALAPEPKLLLLDEPFSGLDTNMRQKIREETLNVLKQSGVATLMVTHDPEEAMFMADRIKIIGANGRILQAGRPHEIYYHPSHKFVAKLFGMMNTFTGIVSDGRVETPLGSVATDLEEGLAAQVLVRPEGVIIETNGNGRGSQVEVTSSHLLGHDNIVRVRLNNGEGEELYVRVHHTFEVELKKNLSARVDPEYAFVYPLDDDQEVPVVEPWEADQQDAKGVAAE